MLTLVKCDYIIIIITIMIMIIIISSSSISISITFAAFLVFLNLLWIDFLNLSQKDSV